MPRLNISSDYRLITSELIERAAEDLRTKWKLGNRPIPDVTLVLENAGILVATLELPSDKQDGFCFSSSNLGRPFVGINTYRISCAWARYDCAHELGHLILHSNVAPQQQKDNSQHKIIEDQAHYFAGAFLFPRDAFCNEARAMSLDYFCSLKRRWGISIAAMVCRAYNLGLIDDEKRSALYRNLTRRGWRGALREPFDDCSEMPMERPRMLKRAVEALLREGFITRSGLQTALTLPEHEVEQFTGVEDGFFKTAELMQLAVPKHSSHLRSCDMEAGEVIKFS